MACLDSEDWQTPVTESCVANTETCPCGANAKPCKWTDDYGYELEAWAEGSSEVRKPGTGLEIRGGMLSRRLELSSKLQSGAEEVQLGGSLARPVWPVAPSCLWFAALHITWRCFLSEYILFKVMKSATTSLGQTRHSLDEPFGHHGELVQSSQVSGSPLRKATRRTTMPQATRLCTRRHVWIRPAFGECLVGVKHASDVYLEMR